MWFYAAILASVFSALGVITSKKLIKNVSAMVLTWSTLFFATPIIFILAIHETIPKLNYLFFIGVAGSVFFYTSSKVIALKAMKLGDLSLVFPLISLGPIFTLIVAMFPPLSERPGPTAIIGVLITLLGTYLLNVEAKKEGLLKPFRRLFENKASLMMIVAVIIESMVMIFDKMALNNTSPKSTTFTLLMENILVIFGLLPILFSRNRKFFSQIFENLRLLIFLGLINAIGTVVGFSAVGWGNVALVATIMRTQVLLVLFLSFLFFKDRPRFATLVGSAVMILGIVLIKIGS